MGIQLKEAVVVEGRYDAARVRSVADAVVVETDGFGIFRQPEKLSLLRRLAETCGLIVLTDSDSAGFLIRDRISAAVRKETVKHAYIPEVPGKERRKRTPSKEGLLGVEGQDGAVVLTALMRAGATVWGTESNPQTEPFLTKARLFEDGLTGAKHSAVRRSLLLKMLGLPQKLSTNRLLEVCNALLTEEEYIRCLQDINRNHN